MSSIVLNTVNPKWGDPIMFIAVYDPPKDPKTEIHVTLVVTQDLGGMDPKVVYQASSASFHFTLEQQEGLEAVGDIIDVTQPGQARAVLLERTERRPGHFEIVDLAGMGFEVRP